MLITRTSLLTGIKRTLDIPVTAEQLQAWSEGTVAQKAMPNLSPGQREFIMTGITDEEWENAFGEKDDAISPKDEIEPY